MPNKPKEQILKKPGGILSGVLESIIAEQRARDYPFEQFAHQVNPFSTNPTKASEFQKIIKEIHRFALDCVDPDVWYFGERAVIQKKSKEMYSQTRKIKAALKLLIPKYTPQTRKSSLLRQLEFAPEALVRLVGINISKMTTYDLTHQNKIKGAKQSMKVQAIKEFWKASFSPKIKYPRHIYIDDRSYTTIALSIVSYFSGIRFKNLKNIYYKVPSKRRKEILSDHSKSVTTIS